jgi:hypothetical protein
MTDSNYSSILTRSGTALLFLGLAVAVAGPPAPPADESQTLQAGILTGRLNRLAEAESSFRFDLRNDVYAI